MSDIFTPEDFDHDEDLCDRINGCECKSHARIANAKLRELGIPEKLEEFAGVIQSWREERNKRIALEREIAEGRKIYCEPDQSFPQGADTVWRDTDWPTEDAFMEGILIRVKDLEGKR